MKIAQIRTIVLIALFLTLSLLSVKHAYAQSSSQYYDKSDSASYQLSSSSSSSGSDSGISYYVYAFYDPKETIVLFNDQDDPTSPLYVADAWYPYDGAGYRANYPEVAFVTLVAVKKIDCCDAHRRLELYSGGDGDIPIEMALELNTEPDDNIIDYITEELPYQLVNLTSNGLSLFNVGGTNDVFPDSEMEENILDWKEGLFLALGDNPEAEKGFKTALASGEFYCGRTISNNPERNTLSAPRNSCHVSLGESDGPIVVIAVKTWNHMKDATSVVFALENNIVFTGELEAEIKAEGSDEKKVHIALNTDNVDFERLDKDADTGAYPDKFIVKGTEDLLWYFEDKLYSNIIGIKVEEAKKKVTLKVGGGIDWLQVAAADIYSNPPDDVNSAKVFNCVREICAKNLPCKGDTGKVFSGIVEFANSTSRVNLNPFKEDMRFNEFSVESVYAFTSDQWRDNTCFHEAVHCYHGSALNNPSSGDYQVYDKEPLEKFMFLGARAGEFTFVTGDNLFTGKNDTKDNLLTFSYDHKVRGFLNQNMSKKLEIEQWLDGIHGDKNDNKYKIRRTGGGTFITNIYDGTAGPGKLTQDDIKKIFKKGSGEDIEKLILTQIPQDLPKLVKCPTVSKVYIYKPPNAGIHDDKGHMYNCGGDLKNIVEIVESETNPNEVRYNYGFYIVQNYSFKFKAYTRNKDREERAKKYITLLTKKGYQLYVLYSFSHRPSDYYPYGIEAYEYDASHFMISHGGEE